MHPAAPPAAESLDCTAAASTTESVGDVASSGGPTTFTPDAAAATGSKRAADDGLLSALAAEAAPWAARKRRRGRAAGDDVAPLGFGMGDAGGINATGSSCAVTPRVSVTMPTPPDPPRASSDTVAAERIVADAERVAAVMNFAAQRSNTGNTVLGDGENTPAERTRRKVIVSNIPAPARAKELADFFTGAIFSATGHTLAAQWQSGEASKVVVGVDILLGIGNVAPPGTSAEVTFGTATGATVAVALNGIQFKGRPLDIRRPKGYSGQSGLRTKLAATSIKDLIAGAASSVGSKEAEAQSEIAASTDISDIVHLSGIPSSMGRQSVYDLLEQFGGRLKGLNLSADEKGSGHGGHGVAQYVDISSATEAVRFSPLLGFIEVKPGPPTGVAGGRGDEPEPFPRRQRRRRFDPEPSGAGPGSVAQPDLGPFEAVLPPKKSASSEDLGPFEAVLPPAGASHAQEDLGPFEAVLPPKPADDDLGPFQALLSSMQPASASASGPACGAMSDLGPFAAALQDFAARKG